jgi:microcystin-dependent protein
MNIKNYTDNRLYSQYKEEETLTLLGGTVHVFTSCIASISNCTFCNNAGLPRTPALAPRGALYIESPTCGTNVTNSLFEGNAVPLDGGALQVRNLTCWSLVEFCIALLGV